MGLDEEIRKRITDGLRISRLPEKTKKEFIEFANDEFCGDFGMALKHLFDFYKGIIGSGNEHIEEALTNLNERLVVLENKPVEEKKPEEKAKKRLNGDG